MDYEFEFVNDIESINLNFVIKTHNQTTQATL